MFYMLLFIHVMGCVWYYVAVNFDTDDNWILRYNFLSNLYNKKDDEKPTNLHLYLLSIYYIFITISTVGYGDIVSVSENEKILSILYMFFGVAIYTYCISMVTKII